jgi:hypothetical protein
MAKAEGKPSSNGQRKVYIREAAEILNRRPDTLRRLDRTVLPKKLRSKRDPKMRNWRYWTPKQIKEIADWFQKTDRRPGKGLPHWNPSEKEVEALLDRLRGPRKTESEESVRS